MQRTVTKKKVLSLEQRQALLTTLYDCSLDIKLEIPRSKKVDMNRMYRSALLTITLEFVAKHKAYQAMAGCIYEILRNTLLTTKRHWKVVNEKQWVLERKDKSAGHLLDTRPPKNASAIYDTVEYSGLTWDDDQYGLLTLDCNLKLFLSPGVHAAKHIYNNHNFIVDTLEEENWNTSDFFSYWCNALEFKEREGGDSADIWACVLRNIEDAEDYWQTKRVQYAASSESSSPEEESDVEESHEDDD